VIVSILQKSTKCKTFVTDLRTQLASTDYGNFLANEPSPISTSAIGDKTLKNLVDQFNYLKSNAIAPLDKFLDYITCVCSLDLVKTRTLTRNGMPIFSYAYMIDNLVLLITGTLNKRKLTELLKRCHPLGWFEGMPALAVATNAEELYQTVLVETPLGALSCFVYY
jgi:V-type H+-transporting ATPase subunit d